MKPSSLGPWLLVLAGFALASGRSAQADPAVPAAAPAAECVNFSIGATLGKAPPNTVVVTTPGSVPPAVQEWVDGELGKGRSHLLASSYSSTWMVYCAW